MVKALDSTYDAGRRGGSWRKVKPVKTLDLVVLAAEWGSGRRQGWLSNLHLGARDPDGGFVMVGKTFKGLTDALLTWQTEAFLEIEDRRDGHTVFVRPELVVEIALDGVQTSTRYPGGVALRFARVKGYRPDKDPEDADLITTVQAMRSGSRLTRSDGRRSGSPRGGGAQQPSSGCALASAASVAAGGAARTGGSCTSGSSAGLGAWATRAGRGPGTLLSVAALGSRGLAGSRGPLALDACAGWRPCGGSCRAAGFGAAILTRALGRAGPLPAGDAVEAIATIDGLGRRGRRGSWRPSPRSPPRSAHAAAARAASCGRPSPSRG